MIAFFYVWDILRWVLLMIIAMNLGGCCAISFFYARRADREVSWGRWLPEHVWRVVIGTAALSTSNLVWALDRIGHPPLWYGLPIVLPANALILWGLIYMIAYQRNRMIVSMRPTGLKRIDDPSPEAVGLPADEDRRADPRQSS